MTKPKYGATVRIPHEIHERACEAAKECGLTVGAFMTNAIEDVLRGYEKKAAIRPRCIAMAEAQNSDPVANAKTHGKTSVGNRSGKKAGRKEDIRSIRA